MTAAELAALVPAVIAFLAAATALLRVELTRRQAKSGQLQPPNVPCSHDQSSPPGGK